MKNKTYNAIAGMIMLATMSGFAQPNISVQPADQTANQSFNATFQAVGTGTPPLSYQWFFASNAIAGAITNVLTVTNTQPTNAGSYFAVVTDASGSVTSRVATLTVILPATLDPKVGPNIRLGDDSPLLPGLNQGEIHIARSFADPNTIIAGFQDGIASVHIVGPATYGVSTDGGLTWRRSFIPGIGITSGGQNGGGADQVAVVDAQGTLYIASLVSPFVTSNYASQLVINKSMDGGQSFGSPIVAATGVPSNWPDKDWIAINTFGGAPRANRIALAYDREPTLNGYSQYSDDGGATWSQPKFIGGPAEGMQNLFLPDGSLAVLYWKFLAGPYAEGPQRMIMVLSKDGGATFAPPTVVMDTSNFLNPDNNFAARFFPSACTDRQAGVIYVAVGAQTGAPTNSASRILFTKSIDQGKTWSAPFQVNDTPPGKTVGIPAIAASPDGQHVTIEFYDKRNDPGDSFFVDLYLAESFDGGDTWEPNLRLSEFSSDIRNAPKPFGYDQAYFLGDYQAMTPSLNFETPAVAAWIDTRAGNSDPYVVRIQRTKGTTFDAWRKLRFSTNDLANAAISGASADPDGDGIPNLAEYAFALEPTHADASPLRAIFSDIPSAGVTLSYEQLAVLSDILFSWQKSTNLIEWTTITSPPQRVAITPGRDPSMQRVETTYPASKGMEFFRLTITRSRGLRPLAH